MNFGEGGCEGEGEGEPIQNFLSVKLARKVLTPMTFSSIPGGGGVGVEIIRIKD